MKRFLYQNSLSIVLFLLFAVCFVGQVYSGHAFNNNELQEHGRPTLNFSEYLTSGHLLEATFENWESEFLQMWALVLLTIGLRQKGSADSKKLEGKEAVDEHPRGRPRANAPWPVKKGGWILRLYEHSLSLALLALFLFSFVMHAVGGVEEYNEDLAIHGQQSISLLGYMTSSRFWFESFQNWQSEFLSVGALIVLSIFLRQRGSPQSKPVAAPHSETED